MTQPRKWKWCFLPAIIGWILLGVWITTFRIRLRIYKEKIFACLNEKDSILFHLVLYLLRFCSTDELFSRKNQLTFMNSNGKIYVVMAVVVIIVLGLFLYLINLDKKIRNSKRIQKITKKFFSTHENKCSLVYLQYN